MYGNTGSSETQKGKKLQIKLFLKNGKGNYRQHDYTVGNFDGATTESKQNLVATRTQQNYF